MKKIIKTIILAISVSGFTSASAAIVIPDQIQKDPPQSFFDSQKKALRDALHLTK